MLIKMESAGGGGNRGLFGVEENVADNSSFTVSGLGFKPKYIIVVLVASSGTAYTFMYNEDMSTSLQYYVGGSTSTWGSFAYPSTGTNSNGFTSVTNGEFSFQTRLRGTTSTAYWWAVE